MNQNIAKTIHSITKSLLLSIALHLAFCATSYALWHAIKTISLSSNKLQKGEFLTASVTFIPSHATKDHQAPKTLKEKALPPQNKQVIYQKNTSGKASAASSYNQTASTLSDIIADPKNKSPMYPEEARLIGKEALCILKITIAPNGSVQKIVLENDQKSCPGVFMREARKAVILWQFSPHRSEPIERTVPINFKLDN